MRIAAGGIVVVHERLIPQALRHIQRFIAQLVGDLSSLVVLADGVGAGGEQTIDRVLFVLLLLPHHGAVLPAGHAGILGRNAIAVFRHMAVGGEKVCSAAAAPAGRMAVLQSVHQIKDVEADDMVKKIPVHKYGFLFLFRVSGKDIGGSQVRCDGEWLNVRYRQITHHIRKHKRRRANMAEQNIFSGLVYCLDCRGTMVLHRAHTMDAVKNNFMCSTYKKKGKDVCSGHYIREQELGAILLDDIRRVTHFARQNELRFAEHIRKKQGKEAQQEIAVLQKKIDTMQKRQAELTKLFKRLYEDSVLGRIPDEQYRILSQEYTAEQKEIQEQLPAMEVRLQELKDSSSNITRFIENAKRYSEIPELTAEILRIFIKRVEVGERAEKYSRTAPQEVRIYYRDIGLVDELPENVADSLKEEIPNEVA